jgi:hypothetical protein
MLTVSLILKKCTVKVNAKEKKLKSYLAFSIALEDETNFSSNNVTFFLSLVSLSSTANNSRV